MPEMTFLARDTCLICGCRLRGWMFGNWRINKNSLVRTGKGPALVAGDPKCPECQHPVGRLERWVPDAAAQARIDKVRTT